jgi:ribA/ribD-fused uncharacterized protein
MITFWSSKKANGTYDENFYLSNFYTASFIGEHDIKWKTSEHYYQAHKFLIGSKTFSDIHKAKTPREAADIGRKEPCNIEEWDKIKDDVMRRALYFKFSQNEKIKNMLIATGDEDLIEASPIDKYWGWGPDKRGKNQLGYLLMELREQLKREKENEN